MRRAIAPSFFGGASIAALTLTSILGGEAARASCMWGVVQPGAPILGRLGGWEVRRTPGVNNSWDIIPTVTTYPPQTENCNPCWETTNLDTSKTGQGIFFGTVGNTVTIQRAGGGEGATRTFGRLNTGLRDEHGARRGSAWVENGRWVSYPAMSDQAPYTRKGASGGHAPNDALARNPQAPPPIAVTEPIAAPDPTPYEEYVYKGTPRMEPKQVPKLGDNGQPIKDDDGKIVYVDARDASGNIIYETVRDAEGDIVYDNDVWEAVTIYPPRTAAPRVRQPTQVQVPAGSFSFEAYPSYLLVQNEMITRVYPAHAAGTAQGSKRIRMFGGTQGAVWSTEGKPVVSDVRYTGGDTTVRWMSRGWWQGELQPILGAVGQAPGAGGTSYNVITLVNATKFLPVKFGNDDVLYDFYLPSGEMAIKGSGDSRDNALIQWDARYTDSFVQATPPPVVADPRPQPSPADNVIFYFNRSVNPAQAYKVVANPGGAWRGVGRDDHLSQGGSTLSPDYSAVLAAISKAGQAEVEAKLRAGGSTKKSLHGKAWTATVHLSMSGGYHHWRTDTWRKEYTWAQGGSIVAINAATGEILQSLPASDWNKVTGAGGRVQVAGNWVNVVGFAGVNTDPNEKQNRIGSRYWQSKHPITISFGAGPDFLAGPDGWRLNEDRKPAFSAMRAVNFDGTGIKMWEWVGPTEGILVWNSKGDKTLQPTGREFFGHDTWGKNWEDGSGAFRTLDKNGNGAVDGDELASVWVWLDANSDAKVQEGELTTLAQKGIDSVAIPSTGDLDDKGGVVVPGGATGPKGKFDVRDWWSVGGIDLKTFKHTVDSFKRLASVYEWTPTGGGGDSKGGMLRYMTTSPGSIALISVAFEDAQKAAEETGVVPGMVSSVTPGENGGFASVVDFGDFLLVSQWGIANDDPRTLEGETASIPKKGAGEDIKPMKWRAKHISGPTLADVVDLATVPN